MHIMNWMQTSLCCLLLGLTTVAAAAPSRIMIVGDSTASEYPQSRHPRMGWGQVLGQFLDPQIVVLNRAVSGCSTRSYVDLGHFAPAMAELGAGDLLLIQFGHNDQSLKHPERYAEPVKAFPAGLMRFVSAARKAGARPVLITPVARRVFDEHGQPVDSHGAWAQAVRDLAAREQLPLIELTRCSMDWLAALGPDASKAWYLHDPVIGLVDDTHFHERGAVAVACMVTAELVDLKLIEASDTTRDIACGAADPRQRLATQFRPSLIEHADAIAQVQVAPHGGQGLTIASPFFADAPEVGFAFRRRVLHAGASIGPHAHGHDEVWYVLSGRGELSLDGKAHQVVPGMAILTRDGSSHSLRQAGLEDLAVLIVYQRER